MNTVFLAELIHKKDVHKRYMHRQVTKDESRAAISSLTGIELKS